MPFAFLHCITAALANFFKLSALRSASFTSTLQHRSTFVLFCPLLPAFRPCFFLFPIIPLIHYSIIPIFSLSPSRLTVLLLQHCSTAALSFAMRYALCALRLLFQHCSTAARQHFPFRSALCLFYRSTSLPSPCAFSCLQMWMPKNVKIQDLTPFLPNIPSFFLLLLIYLFLYPQLLHQLIKAWPANP